MSLNNIVIEQIKDNYYRGEFLGLNLIIDKNTGYFNATKLCNDGYKQFAHWHRSKKTKELLKSVSKIHYAPDVERNEYEVKIGKKSVTSKDISGTYVCKELILDIASWISPDFYLKCNKIILTHAESEFKKKYESEIKELKNVIAEKEDKIDKLCRHYEEDRKKDREMMLRQEEERKKDRELLRSLGVQFEDVSCQNNELLNKVDDQSYKLDAIQNKLDIAVEDRAPRPNKPNKRERFILIKRNDPYFAYYTIRAQDINARSALRRQQLLFTEVKILMDIHFHPNSKTMYVRVKEQLKEKGVIFNLCKISLNQSDITEQDLVQAMQSINDEKLNV